MKTKLLIPFLAGFGLCLVQSNAQAQEFKSHVTKQFTLQKAAGQSVLAVYNLFGSVSVEGYSGSGVQIDVDETITANNEPDLETGKKEVELGFEQTADTLMAYIAEPYNTRPNRLGNNHHDSRQVNYRVQLAYTVKVPFNINLHISTVNNGDIDIKDVYGALKVNNVNGAISIINAKGTTNARTINGNLTVTYLAVPPDASSYYTLNGRLNVSYPSGLSANLQFKSLNGQFFTDFPNPEILPVNVVKTQDKKDGSTLYKLNKDPQVKIGIGGKLFKFETLNGNIYIKRI